MAQCKHYEICGLDALEDDGEGLCILHSKKPDKKKVLFEDALKGHRSGEKGYNFAHFVFPGDADFRGQEFSADASFCHATFTGNAYFGDATFTGEADFSRARFSEQTGFIRATFIGKADFKGALFGWYAYLTETVRTRQAIPGAAGSRGLTNFSEAKFCGEANFSQATFGRNAAFSGANLFGEETDSGNASPGGEAESREATSGGYADFGKATFDRAADFSRAIFYGRANFLEATYTGKADFSDAKFHGNANFCDTKFNADANFREAKFHWYACLMGSRSTADGNPGRATNGLADFNRAIFSEDADFYYAKFGGKAAFSHAEFTGRAWFSLARFGADTSFGGARFTGDADFWRATFIGEADFQVAWFTGNAYFWDEEFPEEAMFGKVAKFWHARFGGEARFSYATFTGEADFKKTAFNGEADFEKATFNEAGDFSEATFTGPAHFWYANFGKVAKFWHARFGGEARFSYATFTGEANFTEATFSDVADFRGVTFTGKAFFEEARFRGLTIFARGKEPDQPTPIFFDTEVDFRNVILSEPGALIFRHADLGKCQFLGTDLRKAEITCPTWPEAEGPTKVYDDKGKKTCDLALLEHLYRGLKQNFEDRRDSATAGDFHYREKEIRRMNPRTRRSMRCLLRIYRWLSGYGEEILRPALLLLFVSVVGMAVYHGFGQCAIRTWLTHLWASLLSQDQAAWVLGWRGPFVHTFRAIFLMKPVNGSLDTFHAQLANTILSVLGPVLLGLLALAVRQRLRR